MRYASFLDRIIDESSKAARLDYGDDPSKKHLLEGSIAGLEACRMKSPPELAHLLERTQKVHNTAFHFTNLNRYWRVTCFMHEVEWVCLVLSAALANQGMTPILQPTVRSTMMASRIILEAEEN